MRGGKETASHLAKLKLISLLPREEQEAFGVPEQARRPLRDLNVCVESKRRSKVMYISDGQREIEEVDEH